MSKNWSVAALLAGAALVVLPASVFAQDMRNLDNEVSTTRVFAGQLSGGPQSFSVSIPAEQALRIEVVTTSSLDPVLKVYDRKSGDLLAEDDDGGEGLNSRALISGEDGRRVRIEVNSFSYDGFTGDEAEGNPNAGSFELRLTSATFDPQSVTALAWSDTTTGALSQGGRHEFSFQGEEGILLEVAMMADENDSDNLDPFLELQDASGEVVSSNDDGGEGLNSVLRYVMQNEGPYRVVASAYGDSAGNYSIRVGERREPVAQLPLQVIGIDDLASGRLGRGYENGGIDPDNILYQLSPDALSSILSGDGGITFRMEKVGGEDPDFANSLDPYLELGLDTPLGFAVLDSDDDGAGELNSLLPVDLSTIADTPALLDMLRLRVTGLGDSEGDYTLLVTEGMEQRVQAEAAVDATVEAVEFAD